MEAPPGSPAYVETHHRLLGLGYRRQKDLAAVGMMLRSLSKWAASAVE